MTHSTYDPSAISRKIHQLKSHYSEAYVWGVRFDTADLPVGHVFPVSRVWANDKPTRQTLPGTACIQDTHLEFVLAHTLYTGTPYIVCGEDVGYGEDQGEILLRECEIMAMVEETE